MITRDIQIKHICSLGFQDKGEGVTLQRVTLRRLRRYLEVRCGWCVNTLIHTIPTPKCPLTIAISSSNYATNLSHHYVANLVSSLTYKPSSDLRIDFEHSFKTKVESNLHSSLSYTKYGDI